MWAAEWELVGLRSLRELGPPYNLLSMTLQPH